MVGLPAPQTLPTQQPGAAGPTLIAMFEAQVARTPAAVALRRERRGP